MIALGAFVAMFKLKWNMIATLGGAALVGILYEYFLSPVLLGA